jgi:hypothetical protein
MKLEQQQDLLGQLMSFLQLELYIHDVKIRQQICDFILKKNAAVLSKSAHLNKLRIVQNEALIYFNEALARYLQVQTTGVITGARAQLLSQQQNNDFLFCNLINDPPVLKLFSATPEESVLEMPKQRVIYPKCFKLMLLKCHLVVALKKIIRKKCSKYFK